MSEQTPPEEYAARAFIATMMSPKKWEYDAVCGNSAYDPFEKQDQLLFIIEHCSQCPVVQQCKKLGEHQPYGVWGGEVHTPQGQLGMEELMKHRTYRKTLLHRKTGTKQ